MFCRECGNEMPDDSKFCERCGTQFVLGTSDIREDHAQQTFARLRQEVRPGSISKESLTYILGGVFALSALFVLLSTFTSWFHASDIYGSYNLSGLKLISFSTMSGNGFFRWGNGGLLTGFWTIALGAALTLPAVLGFLGRGRSASNWAIGLGIVGIVIAVSNIINLYVMSSFSASSSMAIGVGLWVLLAFSAVALATGIYGRVAIPASYNGSLPKLDSMSRKVFVQPETPEWTKPSNVLVSLVVVCGLVVFVSTFLKWTSFEGGWSLAVRGIYIYSSVTTFTGLWTMALGILLIYGAYLLYTENPLGGTLTFYCGIAGIIIPIVAVAVYAARHHGYMHPQAGLWVLLLVSIVTTILGYLIRRAGGIMHVNDFDSGPIIGEQMNREIAACKSAICSYISKNSGPNTSTLEIHNFELNESGDSASAIVIARRVLGQEGGQALPPASVRAELRDDSWVITEFEPLQTS